MNPSWQINIPEITGIDSTGHLVGRLYRVTIASDNSCLFLSLIYLLHRNSLSVKVLRSLAASLIEADPETFNDVILERPRLEYINWIRQSESWGGYIELIVFSRGYNIQITVVDICSGRHYEYGNPEMGRRIFLVYDGMHYDALAAEDLCCDPLPSAATSNYHEIGFSLREKSLITIFNSHDTEIVEKVNSLVNELRDLQRTPQASKLLTECCSCNKQFSTHEALKQHAIETGHVQAVERHESLNKQFGSRKAR